MICIVDIGNYNLKTSNGLILSSKYTTDVQISDLGENIITYNGVNYYMEKGSLDKEYNKVDKNYIPLLLYALSKFNSCSIDLMLGLPINQVLLKDQLKENLENKEFVFKLNGVEKNIKINKVGVVAEGISSFYTLTDEERKKDTLIIDIGGRTVNAASFINKKIEEKTTIPMGMLNLYDMINKNLKSKRYKLEQIERLTRSNKISDIDTEKKSFVDSLLEELKFYYDLDLYDIYITGGGALVIGEEICNRLENCKLMKNPLLSNVTGNYNIAKAKWAN